MVLPSGSKSTVISLDTLDDNRSTAVAPLSVSVELADDIDVGRGDVLVSGGAQAHLPVLARELEATICWLSNTPLRAGDRIALKHTSRTVRATVQELHTRLDPETLDEQDSPVELGLNDIGTVTLRTSSVVVADTYDHNRDSGAFILIDEQSNDTVGAGTILEPRVVVPGEQTRNDNQVASVLTRTSTAVGVYHPEGRDDLVDRPTCIRKIHRRSRCRTCAGRRGTHRVSAGR